MAEMRTTRSQAPVTPSPVAVLPSITPSPSRVQEVASPSTVQPAAPPARRILALKSPPPSTARIVNSSRRLRQRRPKVLCLGMSYPSLESQLKLHGLDPDSWFDDASQGASVLDAVHSVAQGFLTEMDARDLARCIATEKVTNVDVYTVSQENAAQYDTSRHLWANFNRRNFCQLLLKAFGGRGDDSTLFGRNSTSKATIDNRRREPLVQFRQIILDYFWIPQGWDVSHWSPSFFTQTLVQLVNHGLIDMDDKRPGNRNVACGVYIPFCFHCFRQIVNSLPLLSKYYAISFLRKKDLGEISLWKGTRSIDPFLMQSCLGKQMHQEDIYCTFGPQEVKQSMTGPDDISQEELRDILSRLEDFYDIRMMRLRPLKQHKPRQNVMAEEEHEKGGLRGLVPPNRVKRGIFNSSPPVNSNLLSLDTKLIAKPKSQPRCVAATKSSNHKRRAQSTAASSQASKRRRANKTPPSKTKRELFPREKTPTSVPATSSKRVSSYEVKTRSCKKVSRISSQADLTGSCKKVSPISSKPVFSLKEPPSSPIAQITRTSNRLSKSPYAKSRKENLHSGVDASDPTGHQSMASCTCRRRLSMDNQRLPAVGFEARGSMVEELETASETDTAMYQKSLAAKPSLVPERETKPSQLPDRLSGDVPIVIATRQRARQAKCCTNEVIAIDEKQLPFTLSPSPIPVSSSSSSSSEQEPDDMSAAMMSQSGPVSI